MLTRLRFKNWRSLRDVEIADLTPITVFIGANASGKTNIIDGMSFIRSLFADVFQTVWDQRRYRALGSDGTDPVECEFSWKYDERELTFGTRIRFLSGTRAPEFAWLLEKDGVKIIDEKSVLASLTDAPFSFSARGISLKEFDEYARLKDATDAFARTRWVFLSEGFMPRLAVTVNDYGAIYPMERTASNFVFVLQYMKEVMPDLYAEYLSDLRWMLSHVDQLDLVVREEQDTRVAFRETYYPNAEAPTVSAGTARLAAILAAYYSFDFVTPELPGVLIIEEPDTGLNPGLLKRFVEQLRQYTQRTDRPRQFILTTHNPAFLDYFQPEEVRVVSRDDTGETHVDTVPDSIKEIWLDEYGLGEVWKTRAFGGLPE